MPFSKLSPPGPFDRASANLKVRKNAQVPDNVKAEIRHVDGRRLGG